ncbi:MAG: cyclodeaminase/cyclohydrolase family protein [Sphingobium sp.]
MPKCSRADDNPCAAAEMTIADETVTSVLAGIASTKPAPGSGAAGALTLALACATARKALQLSLKHHPDQAELARYDARLSVICKAALQAADRDAHYFACFIAATQNGSDPEMRDQARLLADLSNEMGTFCEDVAHIVSAGGGKVIASVKNDILAAQALCKCADTINRANGRDMRAFLDGAS